MFYFSEESFFSAEQKKAVWTKVFQTYWVTWGTHFLTYECHCWQQSLHGHIQKFHQLQLCLAQYILNPAAVTFENWKLYNTKSSRVGLWSATKKQIVKHMQLSTLSGKWALQIYWVNFFWGFIEVKQHTDCSLCVPMKCPRAHRPPSYPNLVGRWKEWLSKVLHCGLHRRDIFQEKLESYKSPWHM